MYVHQWRRIYFIRNTHLLFINFKKCAPVEKIPAHAYGIIEFMWERFI